MMPDGSVVISASMLDSMSERVLKLLVAQALIEFRLVRFDLFARGVIRADEQVADDCCFARRAAP